MLPDFNQLRPRFKLDRRKTIVSVKTKNINLFHRCWNDNWLQRRIIGESASWELINRWGRFKFDMLNHIVLNERWNDIFSVGWNPKSRRVLRSAGHWEWRSPGIEKRIRLFTILIMARSQGKRRQAILFEFGSVYRADIPVPTAVSGPTIVWTNFRLIPRTVQKSPSTAKSAANFLNLYAVGFLTGPFRGGWGCFSCWRWTWLGNYNNVGEILSYGQHWQFLLWSFPRRRPSSSASCHAAFSHFSISTRSDAVYAAISY
jgi:hypothetical protein